MTQWPVILPVYPLLENYVEKVPSTSIRTEMEQGPAKVRQRTTAGVRQMSLSYFLNKEQIEALDNFYITGLKGGSVSFDFTHPRNDADIKCRFVSPPEYKAANGNYFKVNIELEILP